MTLVDNWTPEELQEMANQCTSMSHFVKLIGYKSKSCYKTVRARCKELNISLDHFTGLSEEKVVRTPENVFVENSTATQTVLRRMYIKGEYTPYVCSICGLEPFWNGRELTLTLDHINGINNDDRLGNLRWVCPNCDRQLDTFCAKNPNRKTYYNASEENYCIDCGKPITRGSTRCLECRGKYDRLVERPTALELQQLLINNNGNFAKTGKQFGVTDNAIRKWCQSYGLPYHSKDYKENHI